MKPTRIIKEPYIGKGRNGRDVFCYECDNGRTYKGKAEMSDAIYMSLSTFERKLAEDGWQNIDLTYSPSRTGRPQGKPVKKINYSFRNMDFNLDQKHIEKVNSYIPLSEQYANKKAESGGIQWTKHYVREMNRLTSRAGLRCV